MANATRNRPILRKQESARGLSVIEQIESHTGAMSATQLAAILGVTPKTVYAGINSGKIPRLIVPGVSVVRLDPRTLSTWLRSHNPALNLI